MRGWRLLVGWQREIERTPWGGFLLGNVWPAYVFALPLFVRAANFVRARPGETLHQQAQYGQELVTIAFLVLVVVLFAIRKRAIAGQRATWLPGAVALAGTFLLNVVAYLPIEDVTSTAALLASSVVIVAGTLFTIWSLATLGRCFGLFPEVRGLVLRGPYRLVRHPVYLGEGISGFGLLLVKPHPVIIALFAAFVALQYLRTVYEERALLATFPDEYARYRRTVPRLIPGARP
jgi:protein-S-isoprenylcysteine O-methyltransferase Ste14